MSEITFSNTRFVVVSLAVITVFVMLLWVFNNILGGVFTFIEDVTGVRIYSTWLRVLVVGAIYTIILLLSVGIILSAVRVITEE